MYIISVSVVTVIVHYYRDVSWWLYLLIGVSIVVTFLLTNKVLDKIATPVSKRIKSSHSQPH